jgi:putative DNA primase/helicase
MHLDSPIAGAGGDWRTGISTRWCSKRESSLSAKERAELAARILRERAEAQAETEARHKDAAARALHIWKPLPPASPRHPYLERKGIAPGIARQSGASLVLPVVDFSGALHGLQFIDEDGGKKFLSGMAKQGHFIPSTNSPLFDRPLWIAEGHATACTLSALRPGVVVIAALDAGNMQSVACEARRRFPALEIVICADLGEIGMTKAKAAAVASRAKWIWPHIPDDAPAWVNDFNDLQIWRQGVAS